jgi:hypothetical protein
VGDAQAQYAPQSRNIAILGCDTGCFNASYSSIGPSSDPVSEAPSDPTSPWYSNVTKLYSKARWVNLPYTAAELHKDHPLAPLHLFGP